MYHLSIHVDKEGVKQDSNNVQNRGYLWWQKDGEAKE